MIYYFISYDYIILLYNQQRVLKVPLLVDYNNTNKRLQQRYT